MPRTLGHTGLFVVKEAPLSGAQLAYPGADFSVAVGELRVWGLGLEPQELDPEEWQECYGDTVGLVSGGELELPDRAQAPPRDQAPDAAGPRRHDPAQHLGRPRPGHAHRRGVRAGRAGGGARLGVTPLPARRRLAAGRTSNSATPGGSLRADLGHRPTTGTPHPERFPNGLGPVVERSTRARHRAVPLVQPQQGRQLRSLAGGRRSLIGLYREYGIRTFKIDGVQIPDKRADRNLRAMLERGHGRDRRAGGLQPRRHRRPALGLSSTATSTATSSWRTATPTGSNYYPHWTLRNLWMLSRYVPPQNLQIEFLNRWRNADRYPADDPLAPQRDPVRLLLRHHDDGAAAGVVRGNRAAGGGVRDRATDPNISRAPEGASTPGRSSPSARSRRARAGRASSRCTADGGYLLVYRELTDRKSAKLRLWGLEGKRIACSLLAGHGESFEAAVPGAERSPSGCGTGMSWALYSYRVQG